MVKTLYSAGSTESELSGSCVTQNSKNRLFTGLLSDSATIGHLDPDLTHLNYDCFQQSRGRLDFQWFVCYSFVVTGQVE